MNLRPYQLAAVEEIRQRYRQGAKKVLCVAPTGAGKTVLFSHIAQKATERGSRVIVIAHRTELIDQASGKLNQFGLAHGIVQANRPSAPHRPVQIASIQTLQASSRRIPPADLVVIDEAHHVTKKNGYSKVLEYYPNAKVLGVTATPWRLDGKGLGDVFEQHVIAATPRQLRDEGFLVPVGGWQYEAIDTTQARVRQGDFVVGDLAAAATDAKVVGDVVSEWLQHARGKRSVLFAINIEHSQFMAQAFVRAGVRAEHVDGTMGATERRNIINRLRSGETEVLCNCNVLTEGFDCPELECVMLCRPTLSTALFLQMVGRGLRPADGKEMCRIHDHAGCLEAHGHPYAERDYSPETTAQVHRGGGGAPRLLVCKQCKAIVDRWPCTACGYMPKPEEIDFRPVDAAAKREIGADGDVPKPKADSDYARALTWGQKYAGSPEVKEAFWLRMLEKHGSPEKAAHAYWWFSGKVARPPREWIEAARAREVRTA